MSKYNYRTALFAGCVSIACATLAPPPELTSIEGRLEAPDTQTLEATRPQLIEEVRRYALRSRAALDQGDVEATELTAHAAVRRYETAAHLAARDTANASAKLLAEQHEVLQVERTRLLESWRSTDGAGIEAAP